MAEPEAPAAEAEPAPKPERREDPRPAAKVPVPARKPSGETNQLEIRAIFGVDHDLSHQEIIRRARALPGIQNLTTVDPRELEALDTLRASFSRWGFGDGESLVMSCPGGLVDFICSGETSLAVLNDGEYPPGVRETLIIVARELDKL